MNASCWRIVSDSWKRASRLAITRAIVAGVSSLVDGRIHSPASSYLPTTLGRVALSQLYICRSEEHTSELQSLMRITYAVFCLNKKDQKEKQIATQAAPD